MGIILDFNVDFPPSICEILPGSHSAWNQMTFLMKHIYVSKVKVLVLMIEAIDLLFVNLS